MSGSGHVFVYRGDLRTLACDAWYLPTDTQLNINPEWYAGDCELAAAVEAAQTALPADWGRDGTRVHPLHMANDRRATPVLATIPVEGTNDPSYHRETLRQFLDRAALLRRPDEPSRSKRLFAVPVIGTGMAGGHHNRGQHLKSVLTTLAEEAASRDVDIALVTRDGASAAVAHALRRSSNPPPAWAELGGELYRHAERVAALARLGQLVVFSGAGLGRSAGLPDWQGLLSSLASCAGLDEVAQRQLATLDVLDQAALLSSRLGRSAMTDHIVHLLRSPHHGLSHGLLANLPVTEFATFNYDELHELAAAGAEHPLAVLPYEPVTNRWLLKMHGSISPWGQQDIVLTRAGYLQYSHHRAALTGLVQALLVTKHVLFVGFSLRDDHFHSAVQDVRQAMGEISGKDKRGTALLLAPDELQQELWDNDLHYVALGDGDAEAARRVEIDLDLVLGLASGSNEYLFDASFESVLTPPERGLRDELGELAKRGSDFAGAPAWQAVCRLLEALGALRTVDQIASSAASYRTRRPEPPSRGRKASGVA